MKKYIMALDQGTTSSRAIIFDKDGGIVSLVQREFPQIFPKAGDPTNFDKKVRTFLDACKNGTPSPVPSSQIVYNQAILDGIAKSSDLGREIELVIPEV